jgi:hypothetical protein
VRGAKHAHRTPAIFGRETHATVTAVTVVLPEEDSTVQVKSARLRIATIAMATMALLFAAAPPVGAAGLTNCTTGIIEGTGPSVGLRGCWENVWVDGVEYRMTFWGGTKPWKGSVPTEKLGNFYVVGPQTDTPQSLDSPFMHDHVVASLPRQNGGEYMPVYEGILVVCSSAACVSSLSGLATTVNGQPLTSVEAIEAAAAAGLVMLVPAGVIVGTLGSR